MLRGFLFLGRGDGGRRLRQAGSLGWQYWGWVFAKQNGEVVATERGGLKRHPCRVNPEMVVLTISPWGLSILLSKHTIPNNVHPDSLPALSGCAPLSTI